VIAVARVGEPGFARFCRELERLGVLAPEERLAWIRLHGSVLRGCLVPLDVGHGVPEELLERLREELE
jgi:hypothetical protein